MPRKGKGQKIQTVPGQEFGTGEAQEAAQKLIPLAEGTAPQAVPPSATPRAGAQPFNRPSERPNEAVTTSGVLEIQQPAVDPERRFKAAMMLPILESMASQKGASPNLRNSVRKLKAFVGDVSEFADRNQ